MLLNLPFQPTETFKNCTKIAWKKGKVDFLLLRVHSSHLQKNSVISANTYPTKPIYSRGTSIIWVRKWNMAKFVFKKRGSRSNFLGHIERRAKNNNMKISGESALLIKSVVQQTHYVIPLITRFKDTMAGSQYHAINIDRFNDSFSEVKTEL